MHNFPPPPFKPFFRPYIVFHIRDWINSRKKKTIHESFAENETSKLPSLDSPTHQEEEEKEEEEENAFSKVDSTSFGVPRIPGDKERPRSSLIGRWRNRRFRHYHHGQREDPLSRPGGRLKYCQVADISHGLPEWLPFLAGSWLRINRAARVPLGIAERGVLKAGPLPPPSDIAFFNLQPLRATDTSHSHCVYRVCTDSPPPIYVNQRHRFRDVYGGWIEVQSPVGLRIDRLIGPQVRRETNGLLQNPRLTSGFWWDSSGFSPRRRYRVFYAVWLRFVESEHWPVEKVTGWKSK